MTDLLEFLARRLVDEPDAVRVEEEETVDAVATQVVGGDTFSAREI